jgi:hypothetical protein
MVRISSTVRGPIPYSNHMALSPYLSMPLSYRQTDFFANVSARQLLNIVVYYDRFEKEVRDQ